MDITDIKIFLVEEEKLKAFVSIVLDRCFMINDIKVIQGRDGLFISMPSRKKRNGQFKDVAHPLNQETRSWLEQRVLGEYDRVREGKEEPLEATSSRDGDGSLPAPAAGDASEEQGAKLDEVERHHLSDAYWSVS